MFPDANTFRLSIIDFLSTKKKPRYGGCKSGQLIDFNIILYILDIKKIQDEVTFLISLKSIISFTLVRIVKMKDEDMAKGV